MSDPEVELLLTSFKLILANLNPGCFYWKQSVYRIRTTALLVGSPVLAPFFLRSSLRSGGLGPIFSRVEPNPQYGMEISETMCDILAEHNLSQCNKHPTRLNNILDLLCSTSPGLVKSILAYPGMSDHSVIVTEVNIKARLGKKTPRQIYIYGKGDMNAVKKDMDDLYQSSFSNIDENEPVDYLWSTFTKGLLDSVKKNIPQKTTSRRWNLPYITTNIKPLINTRKKLYNKAKKTQSETDWSRFKKIRKHTKSKLREAHDDYISDILDLGSLDEQGTQPKPTIVKKFWSYIRAQKKDTVGIPLLKVGQRVITDSVKKAEVLSNQYESVFNNENLTAMPVMTRPRIEGIDNLVITTNGVRNLLMNLNSKKANGPDLLPIRVLKEAASETAPILQVIYSVALQQGHARST